MFRVERVVLLQHRVEVPQKLTAFRAAVAQELALGILAHTRVKDGFVGSIIVNVIAVRDLVVGQVLQGGGRRKLRQAEALASSGFDIGFLLLIVLDDIEFFEDVFH